MAQIDERLATAPDFTLPGINTDSVTLSDYRGKKILVFMWASW